MDINKMTTIILSVALTVFAIVVGIGISQVEITKRSKHALVYRAIEKDLEYSKIIELIEKRL